MQQDFDCGMDVARPEFARRSQHGNNRFGHLSPPPPLSFRPRGDQRTSRLVQTFEPCPTRAISPRGSQVVRTVLRLPEGAPARACSIRCGRELAARTAVPDGCFDRETEVEPTVGRHACSSSAGGALPTGTRTLALGLKRARLALLSARRRTLDWCCGAALRAMKAGARNATSVPLVLTHGETRGGNCRSRAASRRDGPASCA
jgi:hypothetical protein